MSRKDFFSLSKSGQNKRRRQARDDSSSDISDRLTTSRDQDPNELSLLPGPSNFNVSENTNTYNLSDSDTTCEPINVEVHLDKNPNSDTDNSDSSPDSSDTHCEEESMNSLLRKWALNFNISLTALSALLCTLSAHDCFSLPKDGRTLMKTPRVVITKPMVPGNYHHFGIAEQLQNILKKVNVNLMAPFLSLHISIDGLPLFKSSSGEFWPILGSIANIECVKNCIFPIGIYYGKGKPKSCQSFLQDFVDEVVQLISNGLIVQGMSLKIKLGAFICDAPAKSYILGVKGHTGYSSCTKCKQHGELVDHCMTFPDTSKLIPRTHEEFINQVDDDFHTLNVKTPLVNIPGLHFISAFPIDYMHAVCLGVVRTLMYTWILQGPHPCKFPSRIINTLSCSLVSLAKYIPSEFNRKPRSLIELKRWKATEYRQFLLYSGPVVLNACKDLNNGSEIYHHFLSLSIAMTILLSPNLCLKYQQYAQDLLVNFVRMTRELYGLKFLTHNFHSLIHISDDFNSFGPLDNCSAFKYENFLQYFKKTIRKGEKPLQQVVRRFSEMMDSNYSKFQPSPQKPLFNCLGQHTDGPVVDDCNPFKQYKTLVSSKFRLSKSRADSFCFLTDGSIFCIKNIALLKNSNDPMVIGYILKCKESFFGSPYINSSNLGIYLASGEGELQSLPIDKVSHKAVAFPYLQKLVVFPLIHSVE